MSFNLFPIVRDALDLNITIGNNIDPTETYFLNPSVSSGAPECDDYASDLSFALSDWIVSIGGAQSNFPLLYQYQIIPFTTEIILRIFPTFPPGPDYFTANVPRNNSCPLNADGTVGNEDDDMTVEECRALFEEYIGFTAKPYGDTILSQGTDTQDLVTSLAETTTTGFSDVQTTIGALNDETQTGFGLVADALEAVETQVTTVNTNVDSVGSAVAAVGVEVLAVAALFVPLGAAVAAVEASVVAVEASVVAVEASIVAVEATVAGGNTAQAIWRNTTFPNAIQGLADKIDEVKGLVETIPEDVVAKVIETTRIKGTRKCQVLTLSGFAAGRGTSAVGEGGTVYQHLGMLRWVNNDVPGQNVLHQFITDYRTLLVPPDTSEEWFAAIEVYTGVTIESLTEVEIPFYFSFEEKP